MNNLFRIYNDPAEFKAELSKLVEKLDNGDSIKILIGKNLKTLSKVDGQLYLKD